MRPYYETELGKLYHGDCLSIMPHLEPVDLVLTDLPYGLNSKMTGGTWGTAYNNGDMLKWDYVLKQEDFETVRLSGKIAIIWGANNYIVPPSRCWLLWQKPYLPTLSEIEMAWTNIDAPAKVYKSNRIAKKGEGQHPTEKPVGLMSYCIAFSKTVGTVLDPFLGSGTTAVACERLNRRWIGIEIEEKYCAIAKQRIENERKQRKFNRWDI